MPTIEPPAVDAPVVGAPVIGSSSSATEIRAVVVRVCSQLEEHGKILLKLDDHGKILHNHGKMLEQISMSTVRDNTLPLGNTLLLGQYQLSTSEETVKRKREGENLLQQVVPGEGLEVVKYLMVDDYVKVNLEAISSEYGGGLLKTMVVAEVAKTDIVFFNQEEVVGEAYQASADQTTAVFVEEHTMEVAKTEDKASQTTEVVKTEVVISHQEEDVDEASQTKESKKEVEQSKDEGVEGNDDDDGNSLKNQTLCK
ncbi:hypothetical protein GIB67_026485 [Kingdonia uniflora]|uniref:Uncharacterized protein n=1 Tax=Kingdonia uniflora TaxID=39325 RepID=A0A7J7P6C6_9MAGN|nr:hypothetical protein GIB67_026485 [Kingdonia uniflora]